LCAKSNYIETNPEGPSAIKESSGLLPKKKKMIDAKYEIHSVYSTMIGCILAVEKMATVIKYVNSLVSHHRAEVHHFLMVHNFVTILSENLNLIKRRPFIRLQSKTLAIQRA
jgi:hypothetical protein